MTAAEVRSKMNDWGRARIPYLFIIDLEQQRPLIFRLDEIDNTRLLYEVQSKKNASAGDRPDLALNFSKYPESFERYCERYGLVHKHIQRGDTYLLNLTCRTPIEIDQPLDTLFHRTEAKYKLWLKDQFLVFSPECFVRIEGSKIYSYPMKGTIAADQPNAEATILSDEKELAEHYTIVDLIRNDLSMVAERVRVEKFRYIDRLQTNQRDLLQVSSIIAGDLPEDHLSCLGDIIFTLLPAGSVTGAPKKRTLEIIQEAEGEERGYYTGVFGIFDGETLDSGVMIRFIEAREQKFYFRSGGGITAFSDVKSEYQEMIDKVYVPIR